MKNLPERIYLNLNMTPQEVVETKNKDFHEATKTWGNNLVGRTSK